MNQSCSVFLPAVVLALALAAVPSVRADLVLETETAELGKKGELTLSAGVQFERERDGSRTTFTLNQFEYAITDRAEILIEPFFREWDRPKGEKSFHGMGDLEITPSYMLIEDQGGWAPAVVLALKVKVPTAKNRDIGTGKFDYYPYFIFGKKYGNWVFNVNLGYNFINSPAGEGLKNQFIYDLSVERILTPKWSVFAEIFGNSSASPGERPTFAGAVAAEYHFTETKAAFLSVGYDTDHLANIRPGLTFSF